jgi:hypothetical protein
MFGYTATLVLILFLGWLSYYISFWPLGLFVAGAESAQCTESSSGIIAAGARSIPILF